MNIKQGYCQIVLVLTCFLMSSPLMSATFFNADYEPTEIFLERPVALAEHGPVVEFHLVTEKEEDYGSVLTQLQIRGTTANKVLQTIDIDKWLVYSSTFNLIDINFDGYKDMLVLYSGGTNAFYEGFLFNPDTGYLNEDSISLANPTIDPETNEIIELSCGGCACGNYTKTTHRVYDGTIVTEKIERQEACSGDENFYSLSKLVEEEMTETVRKEMSDEY